eukprot:CAMPEP_0117692774 /NCGR_PEP_ID=MMETSP0804-20121206/26506_1 /TAXON_ID=1074897 /ORGANISM="Tetraselmis astigmatica, Strain CCMP880" /LENGTH=348 /DNA_ID=CAMNT_0005506243 /DNA_START=20 /DNA_END=1066 /DNA_ORIENTATION=-
MPHGLTVDHHGNLWLTDAGLHQVFKFSPHGKKLMELGQALEPGPGDHQFCKPTHVAIALAGNFFVADGYCNSRVMHFSPMGHLLGKIEPTEDQGRLNLPHSLLLDECHGLVIVADRLNGKIRSFDMTSGGFMRNPHEGLPYALSAGPYGSIMALLWQAPGRSYVARLDFNRAAFSPRPPSQLQVTSTWEITSPSMREDAPHDLALIPDVPHTGQVAERPIHVLVAETRSDGKGRLSRFRWTPELLSPEDFIGGASTKPGEMAVRATSRQADMDWRENAKAEAMIAAALSGPTDEDGEPEIIVRDKVDLGEAIGQLYMYGLPAALVFGGVAVFLWRKLGELEPATGPPE